MASDVTLGGDGQLFVAEDKEFELEVVDKLGVPVDITNDTIVFEVRAKDDSPDLLLDKQAAITGVYNTIRAQNTQRALVVVTSAEMALFKGSNVANPKTYRFSLRRTNAGRKTVFARGDFLPEKAA